MKRLAAAVVLTTFALPGFARAAEADKDRREWVQLFNGNNLDGWVPKLTGYDAGVNFANTFRVEDGLLKVRYDGYDSFGGRFGHLFYKQPFSHYLIAVEYRFLGEQAKDGPAWGFRNSGIMIHGQPVETMRKGQDFPISIEVQLLGGPGNGQKRPTASVCTPGTNVVMSGRLVTEHCVSSTSPTFDGDEWVRVEAEVHGSGKIVHRVNGEAVLSYEQPQFGGGNVSDFDPAVKQDGKLLESGSISLQAESHPLDFRKVEILNLVGCMDPKALNFKSYFEKDDRPSCRYK